MHKQMDTQHTHSATQAASLSQGRAEMTVHITEQLMERKIKVYHNILNSVLHSCVAAFWPCLFIYKPGKENSFLMELL